MHPLSNSERVMGTFFMLFGVLITSYVMENLGRMMKEMREINKGYDEAS